MSAHRSAAISTGAGSLSAFGIHCLLAREIQAAPHTIPTRPVPPRTALPRPAPPQTVAPRPVPPRPTPPAAFKCKGSLLSQATTSPFLWVRVRASSRVFGRRQTQPIKSNVETGPNGKKHKLATSRRLAVDYRGLNKGG